MFQGVPSGASSETPVKSVVPSNATAMRPTLPPMTSGNTVLPTPGGVMLTSGVQYEPGIPPRAGSFDLSSMGAVDMYTCPPVIHTA